MFHFSPIILFITVSFLALIYHSRLVNVTGLPRDNTIAFIRAYIFLPRRPLHTIYYTKDKP